MKNNVILIMTDQHRQDAMHYACPDAPCLTPNLDALAGESLCFTNAYTTAPVCTPARSSLYSGRFPSVTGMCANIYQPGCTTHEIADAPYLLSRRLIQSGYRCGYTGKWHLGMGKDKSASAEGRALLRRREKGYMAADAYLNYGTLPTDVGFIGDDFPGHGDGGNRTPQFLEYLRANGLEQTLADTYGGGRPGDHSRGGVITSGERTSIEYYIASRGREIADELADGPFFLSLNFWGPHEPYYALREDYELYRERSFAPWPSFTDSKRVENKLLTAVQRPEQPWSFFENNLRHYYACITNLDRQIGGFLEHLRQRGLYDDSYIIFCADHGDSQGCHNGMENKSGHLYDETAKIPMMIKPPKSAGQAVTAQLASLVDLYATVLDIAGEKPDGGTAGVSLLPLLSDPGAPVREDVVTECVGAFPIVSTQRMYRRGQHKYIFHCGGSDELYDLARDPHEMHNLIGDLDAQPLLCRMREGLAGAMYKNGDPAAPWFCKMNRLREWAPAPEEML